ncbi:hypothetical protein PSTG_16667 [Puccinia striiformis f. sp. tritici PST-78]|uniref:Uncharacterized protein n=1 Tax=Puccinia striiformis f. sp. tritici PST-78 TaxID=1165861 RepID=A0A0L0UT03_9BASI|nr:hypothetical protein PSTG_16667 [Puccinia striiformis f. sp. tritici PST-78]
MLLQFLLVAVSLPSPLLASFHENTSGTVKSIIEGGDQSGRDPLTELRLGFPSTSGSHTCEKAESIVGRGQKSVLDPPTELRLGPPSSTGDHTRPGNYEDLSGHTSKTANPIVEGGNSDGRDALRELPGLPSTSGGRKRPVDHEDPPGHGAGGPTPGNPQRPLPTHKNLARQFAKDPTVPSSLEAFDHRSDTARLRIMRIDRDVQYYAGTEPSDDKTRSKIISLQKGAEGLSLLGLVINDQLRYIENYGDKFVNIETFEAPKHAFKDSQVMIPIFHTVRLLQLRDVMPRISEEELVQIIQQSLRRHKLTSEQVENLKLDLGTNPKEGWQNVALSFAKQLKKLILPYDDNLDVYKAAGWEKFKSRGAREYVFRTIGFLHENEYITREEVRELFRDFQMAEEVIAYTKDCFPKQLGSAFSVGFGYFTEHWNWPLLNDSFQLLSDREKRILKITFLLNKLKRLSAIPEVQSQLENLDDLCRSLKINRFMDLLDVSEGEYKRSTFFGESNWGLYPIIENRQLLTGDIEKLIQILVNNWKKSNKLVSETQSKKQLSDLKTMISPITTICQILHFIEKEFYPGLIKTVVSSKWGKGEQVEQFEDQVQVILLMAEFPWRNKMALDYHSHYKNLVPKDNIFKEFDVKQIYVENRKRMSDIIDKLSNVLARIRNRYVLSALPSENKANRLGTTLHNYRLDISKLEEQERRLWGSIRTGKRKSLEVGIESGNSSKKLKNNTRKIVK